MIEQFWSYLTLLYDWFKKLAPSSQPIKFKTKTNRALGLSRFPALQEVCLFHFHSHWFPCDIFRAIIGCCNFFGFDLTTLSRKALNFS